MKSYNRLWNNFISYKNLYSAYLKARKAKPKSLEIREYFFNYEKELFQLQRSLIKGNYALSKYTSFKIYKPKERTIKYVNFKDRVLHHAVINIIEPIFDNSFIFDSYACRKNKGTHLAMKRLKKIIQSKNAPKYYLKCDIKKYFPNIDQNRLKEIISKKIRDKKLLNIIFKIIESDHSEFGETKGIPIGNLTSQLFANIYLNQLDQYVKQKLNIKHYFRYVDDLLIFSNSKKELHIFKSKIKNFLKKELYLEIPRKKTRIGLIKTGVDFVGYQIYPEYIRVRKSNLRNFIKRTKSRIKSNYDNLLIESSINSWLGYSLHANTRQLNNILFYRYFTNYSYLLNKHLV
jgi:retron-type reverse transcriptase